MQLRAPVVALCPHNEEKPRDVHEAFLVETEARPRLETRDLGRDRGVDNSSQGETERKAFRARDRDEAEALPTPRQDRAKALLHLEMASRPTRQDRGHIPHPHHSED